MNTTKGTILVVDDENLNRILLSTNLEESGYAVETAEDGQHALEMLRAQPFDVVLLDLIMPRMDGYQVLEQMKGDDTLRRIPVIVISSMDEMDSIVRCLEMGATDYLSKPFNPVLLHARLNGCLGRLREERMAILREQLAHTTAAQEDERQRIAQELHDGLGPVLASMNIRLRTASKRLHKDGHSVAGELENLADLAQASVRDVRRLIYDLRPETLDELGLVPALRDYAARFQEEQPLQVTLVMPEGGDRLPGATETALFRIVQEALANVKKHACAQRVEINLACDTQTICLRIADDGQGFDPGAPRSGKHLGLWSMRERVEQLGGQFQVESAPQRGTELIITIPASGQAALPPTS
ncbi:MAG TPA: response regulator [Anaerolineae bacterium]|nr:response regulator [Anaerolineae bacterium]